MVDQRETDAPSQPPPEQSPDSNNASASAPPRQTELWNKDVSETGRWGSRNRKELYFVLGLSVVMVILTVVGVMVGTKDARSGVDKNNNGGKSKIDEVTGERVSTFQLPTPPLPTIVDEQGEWDAVRAKFSINDVLSKYLTSIPATVAEIAAVVQAQGDENDVDPYVRAAHWLTSVDTVNEKEWAPIRYALASIYYATGGPTTWKNANNWLNTTAGHCEWDGVACCERMQASLRCTWKDFYNVVELDLYNKSLTGSIPHTLALFTDLQTIFLSENSLTGTINPDVFVGMEHFTKLYLQHNELTGTVPANLPSVLTKLDTFYVQGNRLTGDFPDEMCVIATDDVPRFGMDCDEVTCATASCCKSHEHCFYSAPSNETEISAM